MKGRRWAFIIIYSQARIQTTATFAPVCTHTDPLRNSFGSVWVGVGYRVNIFARRCGSLRHYFGSVWVGVGHYDNILAQFGSLRQFFGSVWVGLGQFGSVWLGLARCVF